MKDILALNVACFLPDSHLMTCLFMMFTALLLSAQAVMNMSMLQSLFLLFQTVSLSMQTITS